MMLEDLDGLKKQFSSPTKALLLKEFTTGIGNLIGIEESFYQSRLEKARQVLLASTLTSVMLKSTDAFLVLFYDLLDSKTNDTSSSYCAFSHLYIYLLSLELFLSLSYREFTPSFTFLLKCNYFKVSSLPSSYLGRLILCFSFCLVAYLY